MTDPIRLYLDEDTLSRSLINALRARNVDIISAHEAGLVSVADEKHLAYASDMERTVLTFNTRDFVRLHTVWLREGRQHAGIIVSDQVHVGQIVRRLLKLLDDRSAQEMENWLEFLSNWK